jgi:hypothetical protein
MVAMVIAAAAMIPGAMSAAVIFIIVVALLCVALLVLLGALWSRYTSVLVIRTTIDPSCDHRPSVISGWGESGTSRIFRDAPTAG